jgi:hypothetical protein
VQLGNIWKNRNILTNTKMKESDLHSCGSLVTEYHQETTSALGGVSSTLPQKVLIIKWYHRTRNVDVLERARINQIGTSVGANRLRLLGNFSWIQESWIP